MVKLHGSVVLANDLTVVAENRYDPSTADVNYQGKFTFISNMNATSVNDNMPLFANPLNSNRVHVGVITNDPVLKAPSYYDVAIMAPLVPELKTGPAVAGILKTNYWNQTTVDNTLPIQTKNGLELYFLSGVDTVYEGFNQVVVKNISGTSVTGMFIQFIGYDPIPINVTGNMQPGDIWTTTVHTGLTVMPTLIQGATITDQPDSLNRWPGAATARFSVVAVGDPVLEYKWYKDLDSDGEIDPGEELSEVSPDLTLYNVQETDQGFYFCTVTDGPHARTVQSDSAYLNIFDGPTITDNPDPLTKWPGESATFSISATGVGLTYKWQFRKGADPWQDIPLAITASYTILSVSEANEGEYKCIVTNPVSSAESLAAMLTVNDMPYIVKHPDNVVAPLNTLNISMNIIAVGTLLEYRWESNRTGSWEIIPGETSDTMVIPELHADHEGQYRCRVANVSVPYDDSLGLGGGVLSNEATLAVGDPGIIGQPQSLILNRLDDASFTVVPITAGDPADLTYQWFKNDIAINPALNPTAITTTLEIEEVGESDEGSYKVTITGPYDDVTSSSATLTVRNLPRIVVQPACPPNVAIGDPVNLGILVESDYPVTYQWRYEDPLTHVMNFISGAQSSTYIIEHAIQTDEGIYRCAVSSIATTNTGPVISDDATLIVGHLLEILSVSGGGTFCFGDGPAAFSVTTQYGRGIRYYQWLRDGNPVGLEAWSEEETFTYDSFVLTSVTLDDAGEYICRITDERGQHFTEPFTLTVLDDVIMTDSSVGGMVYAGDEYVFSLSTRYGCGIRQYQWLRDDVPVGPTRQSSAEEYTFDDFVIPSLSMANAGTYVCRVTDQHGPHYLATQTLYIYDRISTPRILVDNEEVTTEEIVRTSGDALRLEAVAEGGIPPLTYAWQVEDIPTKTMKLDPPTTAVWEFESLETADTGEYSVFVHDSGTDDAVSEPLRIIVKAGVPVGGGLTFALLTAVCAASGALMLRRRDKKSS